MGFPLTFSDVTRTIPAPLADLLAHVGLVGKLVAQDLRCAALLNLLGTTGGINVQGETVKKLDERANEIFLSVFERAPSVRGLASEEMDEPVVFPQRDAQAEYLLLVDPLDGSSNTDCNMPLGAIFSVVAYRKETPPSEQDFLARGLDQAAAGYLLYGSSTMLVYTTGQGVHGFTLDQGIGEYVLSHEHIRMPEQGKVYAANEGNSHKWTTGMRRYIEYLKAADKATGRPYSGRYSGCLVADVHRLLIGGGIYLYPGEIDKPEGKLRLLYEANPLAWVVEQAGGRATTGTGRILEVEPKSLHQRVPLMIGSRRDVEIADEFVQGKR
ncbi:class 1 fructose-bisphosphatase [Nitrospira moscoviensis]|uniref:Fructose-1,6-bisphosphatase class 1 n=1 Tax=Nitrospira moscoviensis TaxID=42253 RepID=A0A0K2GFZ5_NITMO|nr:class 1 fructose-bisphosphatase [Nitrospira moscoviensis]ALA59866.1 Fructose-1,6-bisphosphatase [Nitrospira moscoviensis]